MADTTNVERAHELAALERLVDNDIGVLLVGNAGVGKSHLSRDFGRQLTNSGRDVHMLQGNPSIATMHLGAVAPILPMMLSKSPAELFANTEFALGRGNRLGRPVLIVDDIDQVDPASIALLQHLGTATATVVGTVREERASDPFVLPLWKDGALERLEIGVFDESQSTQLVAALLDSENIEAIAQHAHDRAQGNALLLRELIADAQNSGRLTRTETGWQLNQPLRAERRVGDLFANRFDGLGATSREALELVALGEPLDLGLVSSLVSGPCLENLEDSRLVKIVDDKVVLDHPLLGDVVRDSMPSLRASRLTIMLTAALLKAPSPTNQEILQATRLQLAVNADPDPRHAAASAEMFLSLFDGPAALACAEAAFDPASSQAHVVLGRAQFLTGSVDQAVDTLRAGHERANTDAERVASAVALAETLAFGVGNNADAATVLEATLSHVSALQDRAPLAATLSLVRALEADFTPALELGTEFLESDEIDDLARLQLLTMWTIAAVSTGQKSGLPARIAHGQDLAERHQASAPSALDQLRVTEYLFDLSDGRLERGVATATRQREMAKPQHRQSTTDLFLALAELMRGDATLAVTHIEAGRLELQERGDPIGIGALIESISAAAYAATGDLTTAKQRLDQAIADPRFGAREHSIAGRAQVAAFIGAGDLDGAATSALETHRRAGGNLVWSGWNLYEVVRAGRPGSVANELLSVARQAPVESIVAMAAHCDALMTDDAEALSQVSGRFAAQHFVLYAAEAASNAARVFHGLGDTESATRWDVRSRVLLDRCSAVSFVEPLDVEGLVSQREYEVTRLAAKSTPSQTIANELFISIRTVDNHLRNSYKKLGVAGRHELARWFD